MVMQQPLVIGMFQVEIISGISIAFYLNFLLGVIFVLVAPTLTPCMF